MKIYTLWNFKKFEYFAFSILSWPSYIFDFQNKNFRPPPKKENSDNLAFNSLPDKTGKLIWRLTEDTISET